MRKIVSLVGLVLLSWGLTAAQRLPEFEKARQVKLLAMNRDDVRKIFAGYKATNFDLWNTSEGFTTLGYRERFSTKNATIEADYSRGNCVKFEDWNVPEWRVVELRFYFEKPIIPKDFGINLAEYQKEQEYINVPDLYIYHQKQSGIAYEVNKNKIQEVIFIPSSENNSLLCDNDSKDFYLSKNWFDNDLSDREKIIEEGYKYFADVANIKLSVSEIFANCDSSSNSCSNGEGTILVSSEIKHPNEFGMTYSYTVSGGKIIGQGSKVKWNLLDVKPGIYTITIAVDDGCGFCGKTMTKTVVVKECPGCSNR